MVNKYSKKSIKKLSFSKILFVSFLLVMTSVTLYFSNYLIAQYQSLSASAAAGTAEVFFEPTNLVLPPDSLANLWVTTNKKIGFVAVEVAFNPAMVKLTQEISLPSTILKRVIKKTPMNEANTSGKISLVVAVDPSSNSNATSGSFVLAGLKFATKTTVANQETQLTVTESKTQLVDTDGTPINLKSKSLSLTLNPVALPTPQSTIEPVIPSPTPTPISISSNEVLVVSEPSVSPTKIPSPSPTSETTPAPSPSSEPTVLSNIVEAVTQLLPISSATQDEMDSDTTAPTFTVKRGKSFGKHYIKVKAKDASGIKNITISQAGMVLKSCNSKDCKYSWRGRTFPVSFDISVIDKASNPNTTTQAITLDKK